MMQVDYLNMLTEMCSRRDALIVAIEKLATALRSGALSDEPSQCVSTVLVSSDPDADSREPARSTEPAKAKQEK